MRGRGGVCSRLLKRVVDGVCCHGHIAIDTLPLVFFSGLEVALVFSRSRQEES